MNKVTVKIDGMMCGMCEAHINDTIRKIYPKAKKLSSSHKKGVSSFIIEGEPDEKNSKPQLPKRVMSLKK